MFRKSSAISCLLLLVVLTTQQITPNLDYYKNWNDKAIASGIIANPSFSILSSSLNPSGPIWSRSKTSLSSSDLNDRYSHYKYKLNSNSACTFSCGLRSFLVNINGILVCQRDTSQNYWGSFINSGTQYD